MDITRLVTDRVRSMNGSGIREVFQLRSALQSAGKAVVDLSIGQPHFPVPAAVREAAIDAIESPGGNGYTENPGIPALRRRLAAHLERDAGWRVDDGSRPDADAGLIVTSGTSGAIVLACLALLGPGDECIIPDPYFVMYGPAATLGGGRPVICDTYPDFRLTAERVEPLITPRTKMVIVNSPSNPAGVVLSAQDCRDLLDLCRRRRVVLVSDEIYDLFTYAESRTQPPAAGGPPACPSPAREPDAARDMLLVRGFGKTYGVTGWRLGYVAGPRALIDQMGKLQQYMYVCAPTPLQHGVLAAFDVDMSAHVREYQAHRDEVVRRLAPLTELATPGGAFYAFPRVPERLGLSASAFKDRCAERGVLIVPGKAFSTRDTHFRISYATDAATLSRGLAVIESLMRG